MKQDAIWNQGKFHTDFGSGALKNQYQTLPTRLEQKNPDINKEVKKQVPKTSAKIDFNPEEPIQILRHKLIYEDAGSINQQIENLEYSS